ncbi:MAG: hypothetical protein Kow0042_32220 [Calditrichia bacterium]
MIKNYGFDSLSREFYSWKIGFDIPEVFDNLAGGKSSVEWIKLEREENFQDPVQVYEVKGTRIALFRLEDGYYAIDDNCSHEEASLAEGEVEDGEVECPRHGARFDIRTGRNLSFPAVIPVKSYPVKVEEGEIYIQVEL